MSVRGWGALVLGGLCGLGPCLLDGCAAAPPPPAPTPAPEPPAPEAAPAPRPEVVLVPDPPDAKQGLGELREIVPAKGEDVDFSPLSTAIVASRKGLFAVADLGKDTGQFDEPSCAVPNTDGGGCTFLRFASWTAPPNAARRLGKPSTASVGPWSKLVHMPGQRESYASGKDNIWAVDVRNLDLTIEAIDENGKVTPFVSAKDKEGYLSARVVETSERVVVVAHLGGGQISILPVKRGKKGAEVDRPVPLRIKFVDPKTTARAARQSRSEGLRLAFHDLAAVPALDEKGGLDSTFLMAWTEAIPPATHTPRGKEGAPEEPPPGVAPSPPAKSKHGCGRSSRSIGDASVARRTHLMRLDSAGKILVDRVVKLASPHDPESEELSLVPLPEGAELQGQRFDRQLQPLAPTAPGTATSAGAFPGPFLSAPAQKLEAAGFDQASGEGVVAVREGGRRLVRRFDGAGAFVGEPAELPWSVDLLGRDIPATARAADTWVTLDETGDAAVLLTGPLAGRRLDIPQLPSFTPTDFFALAPMDDQHVMLLARGVVTDRYRRWKTRLGPKRYQPSYSLDEMSEFLLQSVIDTRSGTATPLTPVEGFLSGTDSGAQMRWFEDVLVQRGKLIVLGRTFEGAAALVRDEKGTWSSLSPPETIAASEPSSVQGRQVWGDVFLAWSPQRQPPEFFGSWLTGGGVLPMRDLRASSGWKYLGGRDASIDGPLTGDGWLLAKGAENVIELPPELAGASENCRYAFSTGPRRVVLVCGESTRKEGPSARVGLRVFRY